ncbi:MAG: hypothetical protein IJD57_06505 [Candidatus Gastranaerophilales bacterium]|nr:hypothetical protein [Candidatus Gastranaerophilales bacterium]
MGANSVTNSALSNVDLSALTNDSSVANLAAKSTKLYEYVQDENSNLDGFEKSADRLDGEDPNAPSAEEVVQKIMQAQQDIALYQQQIVDLAKEIEQIAKELEQEQNKLANADSERKAIENQFTQNNNKYSSIIEDIEKATSNLEAEAKDEQQGVIYQAMADYNEEEDGDWGEYLSSKLEGMEFGGSALAAIENLKGQSSSVASELGVLKTKLANKDSEIKSINSNISNLTTKLTSLNETKSATEVSLTQAQTALEEAKHDLVSEEEWALAEENNVNLSEKLPDGSPRYIFAPGKQDGKYHIYDMGNGGATLARQFGCNGGFDIIESGNGYMNNYKPGSSEEGAETIFYMDDCGNFSSDTATYCTCSPLSFDLNGDGVKTSDKIIDYDIDGDGKLDKINDSADAVLVFDKDGDGISGEDGSECFGNNTDLDGDGKKDGFKDGFEALNALAKKEGLVGGADTKLDEDDLKQLQEKYGLYIKTDGYNSNIESLIDLGITEINLSGSETVMNKNYDGKGNDLMTQEGATFKINGQEREYADIWHKKQDEGTVASPSSMQNFDVEDYDTSYVNDLINQTPQVDDDSKIDTDFSSETLNGEKSLSRMEKIMQKYKH